MWQKSKNIYHLLRAILASIIYGNPAKKLTIIGVTGTDGKTTTTNMIYHMLTTAGKKTGMISTISAVIHGKEYDTGFHVSTPDSFALQKYLKKAVDQGTEYMVLEVTSHGLDQNRAHGVHFKVGVITNITHEHLDYHKTFSAYVKAKVKLLRRSDVCVVNKDDSSYDRIMSFKKELVDKKWITYGLSKEADLNPEVFPFELHIPGDFNKQNALAAIAVGKELGIDGEVIRKGLLSFTSPKGRFDTVYDGKFEVVIDFAHTPNAISELLKSQKRKKGHIIHVFGSAGERDKSKRPHMGKSSAGMADHIILTSEDPRGESAERICEDIASGALKVPSFNKEHLYIVTDRQKAIEKALEMAKEDDLVLITGKGHEVSMNFGGKEVHWSDYEAVKKALEKSGL